MKKKKQKKLYYYRFLFIGIIIVMLGAIYLVVLKREKPSITTTRINVQPTISIAKIKSYYSKHLNISIIIPHGFSGEERFGTITLKKNNSNGEIKITRIGTNYETLDAFLYAGFTENTIPEKVDQKHVTFNGKDFVEAIVTHMTRPELNYKAYFFYKDYSVYSLSTSFPSLYPDLDQIVQSFRYNTSH